MAARALSGDGLGASPGNSSQNSLVSRRLILGGLVAVPALAVSATSAVNGAPSGDDPMNMLTNITAAPRSARSATPAPRASQLKAKFLEANAASETYWKQVYQPAKEVIAAEVGPCPPCQFTVTAANGHVATHYVDTLSEFPPVAAYDRGRQLVREHVAWRKRYLEVWLEPSWERVSDHMDALWDAEAEAADAFMREPAPDAETLATKLLLALDASCDGSYEPHVRADYRELLIADAKRLNGKVIHLFAT